MKVYAQMELGEQKRPLATVISYARRVEALGFDGLHVSETIHDPYAAALLAAEHTDRITIRTAIALAFPRSPMSTAYATWDLAQFSGGRFELGLGTQIRQNIEDRYGVPWSDPVGRMREYIEALETIYQSFRAGSHLDYQGRHYRFKRLQPYFNPGPAPSVTPPAIWLGGVNEGICELAGSRAAGLITHPTNSDPRYLEEICLPSIRRGAARSGRDVADFQVVVCVDVATGSSEEDLVAERERQRRLFAFLYSTPPYRRTLELYGWEDVGERLRRLVRAAQWEHLHKVITDEMLDVLIPVGPYDTLPKILLERYGALADGIAVSLPLDTVHDDEIGAVVEALQEAESGGPTR